MITITRKFDFCYGHRLPRHSGKCQQQHGHNAVLEVTIGGEVDEEGMIEYFGDVKRQVDHYVVNLLDHKYLNDFMETPTAENILMWIRRKLLSIYGERLVKLRLYETPNSYADWRPNEVKTK